MYWKENSDAPEYHPCCNLFCDLGARPRSYSCAKKNRRLENWYESKTMVSQWRYREPVYHSKLVQGLPACCAPVAAAQLRHAWPFYVEAHALDLQPVAEDVHQADFFDLEIVEAPDAESPLCVKDGKLEGLVAKSFDVVVLSLVLSFLPSPEKRIEMVAKARQCLRDHRGLLFVVEGGSAIMEGNWYQKDAAAEWSQAMETAGFKVMNFDSQLREGRRSKPVLQWTLETKEVDDTELAPLVLGKELEW